VSATVVTSTHDRVVAAALRRLADQGLRRTTVDDVASEAGISRATLYRAFPGGRDTILAAVLEVERARLVAAVAEEIESAVALRDALVGGLWVAARFLTDHEALEKLMFDEPATVLTHVEFEEMNRTLATATASFAPLFERFVGLEAAARAVEWCARIVLSYLLFPADGADLTVREEAGALVDRHVLAGVEALAVDVRQ
jgi:AcrR family transcriptional regulator